MDAIVRGRGAILENSADAKSLNKSSHFGSVLDDGRIEVSSEEVLFLLETKRVRVLDGRGKPLSFAAASERLLRSSTQIARYKAFSDLRRRGYIVKTALKFGADFRVYSKGAQPGKDHARWILYVGKEHDRLPMRDFAARSRVAHGTRKQLLLAIVDDEGDVTYWEARWLRP